MTIDNRPMLTLKDFLKRARMGETKTRAEIKSGRLKAQRVGSKILISPQNADDYLESLPSATTEPEQLELFDKKESA